MKELRDIEIINILTKEGKLVALISYQNLNHVENMTNGYDTIEVPINPREIQLSSRGNMLVNQSTKSESVNVEQ